MAESPAKRKMGFGKSLRPLYVGLAGLALAAAVACGGSAAPPPTVTPAPTLEAAVEAATPAATAVPLLQPSPAATAPAATYAPVPTAAPPPTVTPVPPIPQTPDPTPSPPPPPTVTPLHPTPTPTPIPTPTPTPRPNPVTVYAASLGLPEPIVNGLTGKLGMDNDLSQNDKLYVDYVAAARPEVRQAMVDYVKGEVTAQVLTTIDTLLGLNLDQLLTKAVLTLPEKRDFTRNGLSALEAEVLKVSQKGLFTPNFRASKHSVDKLSASEQNPFIQSYILKMLSVERVKDVSGKVIGLNYDTDVFDSIDDDVGNYKGVCVLCVDPETGQRKKYVTSDERRAYYAVVNTRGHHLRRLNSERMLHSLADALGLLVRPLDSNKTEDYDEWFYQSNLDVGTGSTIIAFSFQNASFVPIARNPDGTIMMLDDGTGRHLNMTNIVQYGREKYAVSGVSVERGAVEGGISMVQQRFFHTRGSGDFDLFDPTTDSMYRAYAGISQSPFNPTGPEVFKIGIGGSGTATSWLDVYFKAGGLKSFHSGLSPSGLNLLTVLVNDKPYYGEGNDLLHRVINSIPACWTLANSVEQVTSITLNGGTRYNEDLCSAP